MERSWTFTNFKLWPSAGGGGSGERGDLTVGLRKKDRLQLQCFKVHVHLKSMSATTNRNNSNFTHWGLFKSFMKDKDDKIVLKHRD